MHLHVYKLLSLHRTDIIRYMCARKLPRATLDRTAVGNVSIKLRHRIITAHRKAEPPNWTTCAQSHKRAEVLLNA